MMRSIIQMDAKGGHSSYDPAMTRYDPAMTRLIMFMVLILAAQKDSDARWTGEVLQVKNQGRRHQARNRHRHSCGLIPEKVKNRQIQIK